MDVSSIIISDYMNMQSRMGKNVVIIIVLLVVLVAMSAVLVYVFMRRSGRRKAELDLAMGYNSTLRESLEEITVTKEQMENVLTRRNAMALESFLMMSDYINGVDKFCKTTANMIVSGQSCKAHKALQEGCSAQFLASMYASFDRWFMSVHPDFIERFTALLRPEERGKFVPDAAVSSFCRIRKQVPAVFGGCSEDWQQNRQRQLVLNRSHLRYAVGFQGYSAINSSKKRGNHLPYKIIS